MAKQRKTGRDCQTHNKGKDKRKKLNQWRQDRNSKVYSSLKYVQAVDCSFLQVIRFYIVPSNRPRLCLLWLFVVK